MTEQQGLFTIPTRLYLTEEQRTQLDHLLRERERELAELLTDLVVEFLAVQPPAPPAAPEAVPNVAAELRQRRAALAKLRAQRGNNAGTAWLNEYIAEIEAEVRELEARNAPS